jgi:type IV pilus assembly protein PilW
MMPTDQSAAAAARPGHGAYPQGRRVRGFSLIELMVSIVIGLLALGFATRLVVNGESNKQAAVGGSDAMQNGVLALFSIERELSQAGWGMNDPLINGCDTNFYDLNGYALLSAARGSATVTPLAPVVIQSVSGGSDVLSINSGTSFSNTGMVKLSGSYASGTPSIDIDRSPYGFNGTDTVVAGGDVIVVAPEAAGSARCAIAQVSSTVEPSTPGGQNQIKIASGGANRYNQGSLGVTYSALTTGGRVFNLGPSSNLSFHTWSLNGGFLQLRATNLAGTTLNPATVTDNIVAIKAQYGLDRRSGALFNPETGMQIDTWSGTMIDADGDGVAGSAGDYARIAAVRVAVVARSRNPEKPNAAGVCTATADAPFTVFDGSVSVPLAVTGDPVDWKCYRYRSFEAIVPLRNSAWRPTA